MYFSFSEALRLVRRIIDTKDEVYCRYIRDKKVFKPIVAAFLANGERYNLLNSSFLDLFEFIQFENITTLVDYVANDYMDILENVTYVKTFINLKRKYESRREIEDKKSELTSNITPSKKLPERLQSQFDKERRYDEDESLFDDEEPEHENVSFVFENTFTGLSFQGVFDNEDGESPQSGKKRPFPVTPIRKSGSEPMFPSIAKRKKNGEDDGVASIFGGSASLPNISKQNKITIKMPSLNNQGNLSPTHKEEEPLQDAVTKTILLKKVGFFLSLLTMTYILLL